MTQLTTEEHIVKLCRSYDQTVYDNMIMAFEEAFRLTESSYEDFPELWAKSESRKIADAYLKSAQKTS